MIDFSNLSTRRLMVVYEASKSRPDVRRKAADERCSRGGGVGPTASYFDPAFWDEVDEEMRVFDEQG